MKVVQGAFLPNATILRCGICQGIHAHACPLRLLGGHLTEEGDGMIKCTVTIEAHVDNEVAAKIFSDDIAQYAKTMYDEDDGVQITRAGLSIAPSE